MSLPVYHHVHFKTGSSEEILGKLSKDLNIKNPVALHLEALEPEQQRETLGLIENFFHMENASFEYPYPIYVISLAEASSSGMPLVASQDKLPRFFYQKEGRMNVKETHLALKNKLLHQEIKNVDPATLKANIESYATVHKAIFEMQAEGEFYKSLMNEMKAKKRG